MQISFLGAGAWGTALANLLCRNGHRVRLWSVQPQVTTSLRSRREHPNLPGAQLHDRLEICDDLDQALEGAQVICEAVTTAGVRPVCEQLVSRGATSLPFIITSKGIERGSQCILPEVVQGLFGEGSSARIGVLSGPSFADEVMQGLPTQVVGAAEEEPMQRMIQDLFTSPQFHVHPCGDTLGVALGGALKNVIAVATGMSDGLELGFNYRAALLTQGLHEIADLASALGAQRETLLGLAGLGDVLLTAMSPQSRNYQFGRILGQHSLEAAGSMTARTTVEGAFTARVAVELALQKGVAMPICEAVLATLEGRLQATEAMERIRVRSCDLLARA